MRKLIQHSNGVSTYGFNLLNDRQVSSIFQEWDVLHCSINENKKEGRVICLGGAMYDFTLSLTGISSKTKIEPSTL